MIPVSIAKTIHARLLKWERSFSRPVYSQHIGRKYMNGLWIKYAPDTSTFEVYLKPYAVDAKTLQSRYTRGVAHGYAPCVFIIEPRSIQFRFIPDKHWLNNLAMEFLQGFTGKEQVYLTWIKGHETAVLTLYGKTYRTASVFQSLTSPDEDPIKTLSPERAATMANAFYAHMRKVMVPFIQLNQGIDLKNYNTTPLEGYMDEILRDAILAHSKGAAVDIVGLLASYYRKTRVTSGIDDVCIAQSFLRNTRLRKEAIHLLQHHGVNQ